MDYKYIEQLLDRYFNGETTLEEEQILRTFFAQENVPDSLGQYRPLFAAIAQESTSQPLGDDFDEKILRMVEQKPAVKAKTISLSQRMMPFFKAAAAVAIVLTIGNAAQFSTTAERQSDEINYANFQETYDDPSVAYDKVEDALQLISEGISATRTADSTALGNAAMMQDSIAKQ